MKVYGLECDECHALILANGEPADFLLARLYAGERGWLTGVKVGAKPERDLCQQCRVTHENIKSDG